MTTEADPTIVELAVGSDDISTLVAAVTAADLVQAIKHNSGSYTVPTVNGDTLTASILSGNVYLQDSTGEFSKVIATDLDASNGVVHLVNTVVMPK